MATLAASAAMTITPLSEPLGAEITGLHVPSMDDAAFNVLRDALHDRGVVVVRGQALNPAEETVFARRFGEIQYHINSEYKMEGHPEVLILSTEVVDGRNLGIPDAGADWHSDHSYVDVPTAYTILQSVIVPTIGGDTQWKSMAAAYDALPEEMKARLDKLVVIHSFNRNKNPRLNRPTRHANEQEYFDQRSPPDAYHPLVRTHPFTGRKALFISPRFAIGIKDMPDAEAQPLLDELFAHIDNPAFVYHHKWRSGDLVIWDNRQTLHLALGGVRPPQVRRMHRVTVQGEVPV